MIRLEYDVPTNGVRVSFVIRDDALTVVNTDGLMGLNFGKDSIKEAPETIHNLTRVRAFIDATIKQLEE